MLLISGGVNRRVYNQGDGVLELGASASACMQIGRLAVMTVIISMVGCC